MMNGPQELTKGGNRKAVDRNLILKWVKECWDEVTPEIIRKSFKKCGIPNALDGTEDDLLFKGSEDEEDSEG